MSTVRVPNSIIPDSILIPLIEGPLQPYQCMIWANQGDPPEYKEDLTPLFHHQALHTLIQIGPHFKDIDGEYAGAAGGRKGRGCGVMIMCIYTISLLSEKIIIQCGLLLIQ